MHDRLRVAAHSSRQTEKQVSCRTVIDVADDVVPYQHFLQDCQTLPACWELEKPDARGIAQSGIRAVFVP